MSSDKSQAAGSLEGYLEFIVASQNYAIPISNVREINQIAEITPVPRAATHVCGVMNLRGQVLPVIDLKVRLNGQVTFKTRSSCIIVIETKDGQIGLLVDSVCRVIGFSKESISAAPDACHLPEQSLVAGVAHDGTKTITLLSMEDCIRAVDCDHIRSVQDLKRSAYNPGTAPAVTGKPVINTETKTANFALRSAALRLMD